MNLSEDPHARRGLNVLQYCLSRTVHARLASYEGALAGLECVVRAPNRAACLLALIAAVATELAFQDLLGRACSTCRERAEQ